MKKHKGWSYAPYKPLFFEGGDIYICRLAPSADAITLDWLDIGAKSYKIYCRERFMGEYKLCGETDKLTYTITSLMRGMEYEFYVEADGKKSRVRIARCDDVIGTVVNYLHPDDMTYSFSGRYLCSPSIVRHPDGYLLASMDLYEMSYPQNLTLIFRSDDEGKSWHYVSELFPCFWGKMFIYEGELYMLGCSTEYGDLLIGKSADGGKTFTDPTVLMRGGNGKNAEPGMHKNPQPVVEHAGRIWNTCEWGSWSVKPEGYHAPMVMSAPLGCDLLDADNWSFSEPIKYNPHWEGVPEGKSNGNIEGCLVEMKGGLYNVMRFDMSHMTPNFGKVIAYKVNTEEPEKPLEYAACIDFPANHSKFVIKYDERTKKYYSLATRIENEQTSFARNLLSLMSSEDGKRWGLVRDIYNLRDCDSQYVGVQYVDFIIEGDEILLLARTAMNKAHSFHDSNYSTFDKIKL